MQQIVIDSSVGVCWAMPDEFSLIADGALDRLANAEMLVPTLFWYELANVLVVNERRGRIDRERSAVAVEKIRTLQFHTDDAGTEISSTIDFARTYALTVYDACYLELAARVGAVLATLDVRLQAAAVSEGVALVTEA